MKAAFPGVTQALDPDWQATVSRAPLGCIFSSAPPGPRRSRFDDAQPRRLGDIDAFTGVWALCYPRSSGSRAPCCEIRRRQDFAQSVCVYSIDTARYEERQRFSGGTQILGNLRRRTASTAFRREARVTGDGGMRWIVVASVDDPAQQFDQVRGEAVPYAADVQSHPETFPCIIQGFAPDRPQPMAKQSALKMQ
jgi:hypothetical protein